jgi:hypothetical protein
MKKNSLLLLYLLLGLSVFAQNDKVKITGQADSYTGTVVEVAPESVTFLKTGSDQPVVYKTKEIDKILLGETGGKTPDYTTADLLDMMYNGNTRNIVWMGLDYTFLKVCHEGGASKYSPWLLKSTNDFVAKPDGEFKMLWKPRDGKFLLGIQKVDRQAVDQANAAMDMNNIFNCEGTNVIPLSSIREAIGKYPGGEFQKGIGLVIFYSRIDKAKEAYTVYFVFYDLGSQNILITFRRDLTGTGITMEWHWTQQLLGVFNQLSSRGDVFNKLLFRLYE